MTLSPLRKRLDSASKKSGIRLDVIQQDYLLSWILAGISQTPSLSSYCIFKGGTALKKCYFGEYRFSEDIDFTALNELPCGDELEGEIKKAVNIASEMINEFAPVKLRFSRYSEKYPHPDGQEAFSIYAQYQWQNHPLTKVMIEITRNEDMVLESTKRRMIHLYGEDIEIDLLSYSLEEIVLEKHRAILQHTKKLYERDWGRSRARDYYDLWRIFKTYKESLQLDDFKKNLIQKCSKKEVFFKDSNDFFQPITLNNVRKTWNQWLGPLVKDLPNVNIVIEDLQDIVRDLLEEQ